jgi:benzoyl-CoA-dihydrodiol lyase
LTLARQLDDALLRLRANEPEIGVLVFRTRGSWGNVFAGDRILIEHGEHWFIREVRHYWKRVLKRLDLTARTLVALVDPGSCYSGTMAEILFACDRTAMLDGWDEENDVPPTIFLNELNFGAYPMANGLSRLATRFMGEPETLERLKARLDQARTSNAPAGFEPEEAGKLGLVTTVLDEVDWEDEVRIMLEERASFSPDALTGMEANLRFPGPETMETKIFGRLSAWQNWIFQRPNAAGPEGALKRYGTGQRASFDPQRT